MERTTQARPISGAVLIGAIALSFAIAFCLFALMSSASTVSGTALLPNGKTATINGPFSCSEGTSKTEIEAGGHVFAFSPTTISIDGVFVRSLDSSVTDVNIDAGYWSATLSINGSRVSTFK